jgi:hypothetical protein
MFRRLYEAAARRLRPRTPPSYTDLAQEVRTPDPYVWRLPTPHDARWRRWHKRSLAAGHYLAFPAVEDCWQPTPRTQPPSWHAEDDPVRPYVTLT